MEKIFKDFLFSKHILVAEKYGDSNTFETLFSIANLFNIRIKEGQDLVEREMIEYISGMIGKVVPEPFYKGFPDSVRKLTSDELLFDQMVHYSITYGFGKFDEAGHSVLEEYMERTVFSEKTETKDFIVVPELEALKRIQAAVDDMALSTRPLSQQQYDVVREFADKIHYYPVKIASKNLAIRLLNDVRDQYFINFIKLSDVLKLVEEINYRRYGNTNIRKLNLKNQDRRFITFVIDFLLKKPTYDIINCYERKAEWCGLLHHIHYEIKDMYGRDFVFKMRGRVNHSVYSDFEEAINKGKIEDAVRVLEKGKGSGAILRNLDYLISRCENEDDIKVVIDNISSTNVMILIQLLIKYSSKNKIQTKRTFTFTKFEKMKVHSETDAEAKRRRTYLSDAQTEVLRTFIKKELEFALKKRLGKVYVDDDMAYHALPVQETASSGGYGVLTKGTRLHIDDFKKLRAFTYWEKVDDIDLSCFGITEDGKKIEFSWRTMAEKQSDAIVYSGDQTSGYKGGSEYFDINLENFKKEYPNVKYIIFCDNVFSPVRFCDCFCKAGYMLRDTEDSGKVFEPKSVESSFIINSDSTFAYLFGLDLEKNDFIWLNVNRNSYAAVAGESPLAFLIDYFFVTDVINVKSFFEMMATEIVSDPKKADIVVSDKIDESEVKEGAKLIHSYDFEKMTALMG
ncbi:MAG: hypothetical protein IKP88_18795 [Lachnospiraceae bacterium]|nr:hypothetical protein [Lachnospiraceae bacterium]